MMEGFERGNCSRDMDIDLDIAYLYASMGIDVHLRESDKMKDIRLDALYVQGLDELNSREVFSYFEDFKPSSVEWIDDDSCFVIWLQDEQCARALLHLSKPLPASFPFDVEGAEKNTKFPDMSFLQLDKNKKIDGADSSDYTVWRLGEPHPKAERILIRFATKGETGPDNEKKVKKINYFKKIWDPNASREAFTKPLPESVMNAIRKKYTKVKSLNQRTCYVEDFNKEYKEYNRLVKVMKEHSDAFSELSTRLYAHAEGSPEYVGVAKVIKRLNKTTINNGYNEDRKRFDFLKAKLYRISEVVHEFDRNFA